MKITIVLIQVKKHSHKSILRIIPIDSFKGGISGRETERKTKTDIADIYQAHKHDFYNKPFKIEEDELIDKAF